jgi:hypothetical protein
MVLLIAFGVMNIIAMVILASVVLVAKCFTRGVAFSRMTGKWRWVWLLLWCGCQAWQRGLDGAGAVMSPVGAACRHYHSDNSPWFQMAWR